MWELKGLKRHIRLKWKKWELSRITLIASDMRTCRKTLIPKVICNKPVKYYWLLAAHGFDWDRPKRSREERKKRRDTNLMSS